MIDAQGLQVSELISGVFYVEDNMRVMAEESSKPGEEVPQIENDECKPIDDYDRSRRRSNALKSMLRNVIYKNYGENVTQKITKSTCKDIAQDEIDAFSKTLGHIMSYIPCKKNWLSTAHKALFMLMANQVLSTLQYTKFTVRLCPLTPEDKDSNIGSKEGDKNGQLSNEVLYWLTEGEKEKRGKIIVDIGKNKEKLSAIKSNLYLVRRHLRESNSNGNPTSKRSPVVPPVVKQQVNNGQCCFLKAELVILDDDLINQDTSYGGTDKRIVIFTEASKFDLPRFKSYIELCNRYQYLEVKDDNESESKAAYISSAFDTTPSNTTTSGTIAPEIKKVDVFDPKNFQDYQQGHRQEHREFYYNNSKYSGQQRHEVQQRRFINKLCVRERNHVSNKHPALFNGDCGYGTSSPTKGYLCCRGGRCLEG